jgi:dienelactone hydrolase
MNTRSLARLARRILLTVPLALALAGGAVTLWILDHTRLRHDHFLERRGPIAEARVEPAVAQASGHFVSEAVQLQAETGLAVYLRVLRPATDDGPLPLMVLLGGHRTGQDAVDLIGDPGRFAVAALDYPYDGPTRIRGFQQFAAALPRIQQALLDTPPAVSLALDWLVAQPWVDTGHIELVGVSLGTPFAAVAGALDERFRRVWIIHGGAGNRGWLEYNLGSRVPSDFWRPMAASVLHTLAHGASFDTEAWVARISPRPVVVIGATADERLPRHKVENLYAAAGEPRELLWTESAHIDPRRPEIVQALLAIVRERMEAGAPSGLPAPVDARPRATAQLP